MTTHESDKYNGYKNRETWLASLWLSNDERTYTTSCGVEIEIMDSGHPNRENRRQKAVRRLVKRDLWDVNRSFRDDTAAGTWPQFANLVNWSEVSAVDWDYHNQEREAS